MTHDPLILLHVRVRCRRKKVNVRYLISWWVSVNTFVTKTKVHSKSITGNKAIRGMKWRHSHLWSHYDLYVMRQHGVLCGVDQDLLRYSTIHFV